MFKLLRNHPKAVLLSILVHVVVIALVVISFQWTPAIPTVEQQPIIQAVAVDENKVSEEIKKLERAETEKRAAEEKRKRDAEVAAKKARDKRLAEERRLKEAQKKRAVEEQRRKEAELKRVAEEKARKEAQRKRITEEKALARKRAADEKARKEAEAKRIAARKAEKERLEKLRLEREAEEKRLAELEAKRRMEEEQRRKAEEERQRRAEEERALQEQIAAENARLEQERQLLASKTVSKYTTLIRQKVSRNWIRPAGSRNDLTCTVSVRVIPGGDVVGVTVVNTSGDPVFDRSVETAVRRASPLPIPTDPLVFERMREITFIFDPAKG